MSSGEKPLVQLIGIGKRYGTGPTAFDALHHVDLSINAGEFVAIMGPSGSGKSTTMNIIGALDTPTRGQYLFNGFHVEHFTRDQRALLRRQYLGFVFQGFNLLPRTSAIENVELPLLYRGEPAKVRHEMALEALDKVGLTQWKDHTPAELSGGQQQRVAIARALANEPKVLLLDEPLSALDLKLRKDMQNELKKIQQAIGITFIFVTHDQEEALSMSDTVVVMDKGEIQQIGSPIDIYNEPKNAFVADFIGESNILDGTMIEDYLVEVAGQRFKSLDSGFGKMAPVDVVIRPEDIDIVPTGSAAAHINGVVTSVTFKGVHYEIIVDVDGFKWMIQTTDSANVGDKIGLALTPDDIHVMAKSVYSGTMGDYSTFSDEMEEALQEEGSEHED